VARKKWYLGLSEEKRERFRKIPLVLVDDTIKALGEIARNYRRNFIIPIIAIAGSNGKTTAKDLIAYVLSKKYTVLKTEKNYNNAIGVPLTLLKLNRAHEIAVIETGTNHFGEVEHLCKVVEPQFGLITNIGKEHLEFFGSVKGAAKAEFELIDYLEKNYGSFFLNSDDLYILQRLGKAPIKCFTFGSRGKPDIRGRMISFDGFYPFVEIKFSRQLIKARLNVIGSQGFETALCAAAVGFYFEVKPEVIRKALTKFTVSDIRRNELKNKNGIMVIDDTYNSNPSSVLMALENLKMYRVRGKKHIVLADMLELGRSACREHKNIGEAVGRMKFENLYTYGKWSYETFKGARNVRNNFYFSDKQTLIDFLKITLKRNDLVLIKGSRSMKMEEVVDAL
jgi:UDP-N-acetylmuramoyl-tripeptide--D-alanyl-D-alanine ligase